MKRITYVGLLSLLMIGSLAACSSAKPVALTEKPTETATYTPTTEPSATATVEPTDTATPTKTHTSSPTPIDMSLLTSPIIEDAYDYYFSHKTYLSNKLPHSASLYDMAPHLGFYWPYLAYTPSNLRSRNILVVIPNTGNWNFQDDDNFITQYEAAVGALNSTIRESEEIGSILLVPVFPRFSIPHTFGAQYLSRFSLETEYSELKNVDKQLLSMADIIISEYKDKGVDLSERLLFTGYSAQSWFSSRFVALNPSRVQAVAIGGCAWPTVPIEEYLSIPLPFPLGLGSLEQYNREIPRIEDYTKVKVYIYWGTMDGYVSENNWDFGPISDGYQHFSYSRKNAWFFNQFGYTADELFNSFKEIFESTGNNVIFDLFEGLSHSEVYHKNYWKAVLFLKQNAEYFD